MPSYACSLDYFINNAMPGPRCDDRNMFCREKRF
jgi:hypothetical protein